MIAQTVVAQRGRGYRQYRIPAMAVTGSGRIIAAFDGRPDVDDLPGPIDVVYRYSDDHGQSWSAQQILCTATGFTGCGDPSILVDRVTGQILVFSEQTELAGFFDTRAGSADGARIRLSVSDDDGLTWSHRYIEDQLHGDWDGIFAASGMGTQLANGRLLQCFVVRRGTEIFAAVAHSDDHGVSWQLGEAIPGGNESAVTELSDGRVLLHSRATPRRLTGISTDGGQSFVMAAHPELVDPSDNGGLCTLADGSVVCSYNHDADLRHNTVLRRSCDGGRTWPTGVVIAAGSSGYSTVCQLADGRIGVLYERNGYSEIVFAVAELSDFIPWQVPEPTDFEFTVVLRLVRPARRGVAPGHQLHIDDAAGYHPRSWREIGQAGDGSTVQTLYARESYDAVLGPVEPGLRQGDELKFTGRLQSAKPVTDLRITSNAELTDLPEVLEPGRPLLLPRPTYQITQDDVTAGTARVWFTADGYRGGKPLHYEVVLDFDIPTGCLTQ